MGSSETRLSLAQNCLVDGKGNLFLCIQRDNGGCKEHWIARYGKALDDALGSTDVNKVIAQWDMKKKTVVKEASRAENVKLLAKNSPFEGKSSSATGGNLNQIFEYMQTTAAEQQYDDVFMQVIGPLAQRTIGPDRTTGLVSANDEEKLLVWRPNPDKEHYDEEDAAMAIVQHYLPPDGILAVTPKPHAFTALHNKPNPNTKLDLFVQGERVDLQVNLWNQNPSPPSEVLEVLIKGCKVAELQVKSLPRIGFSFGGNSESLLQS